MKEVTNSASHCVYFWYYFIGANIGQLDVYESSSVYGDKIIWTINQTMNNYWSQGRGTIDGNFSDFSVRPHFIQQGQSLFNN